MNNTKIIRDTVHGYIEIDKDIVSYIIDSPLFQRLRRIEQTSMRCLYPSARHDRFIHSIGTYYLAQRISKSLTDKFRTLQLEEFTFDETLFKKLQINLELAALLHDIGHSPFSHTLEGYFKLEKHNNEIKINYELKKSLYDCIDSAKYSSFEKDYKKASPAPHEIVSSIIAITCFKDELNILCNERKTEVDYDFIVRAITGTLYNDFSKTLENCFIKLLNSSAIDVDKLDYITRDSLISGYDNVKIDTERLITSVTPYYFINKEEKKQLVLVYDKTALSVIQNVITCRNALYTWIYSHHKVQYESELICNSIQQIAKIEQPDNPIKFITELFSVNSITNNYLCDDDIWCLLKKHRSTPDICEIFERGNQKRALWKSFVEFKELFPEKEMHLKLGDFSVENFKSIAGSNGKESEEFLKYIFNYKGMNIESKIIKTSIKLSSIDRSAILILLNGHIYSYTSLLEELNPNLSISNFLYIYIRKDLKNNLNLSDFISYLKKYPKFIMLPPQ